MSRESIRARDAEWQVKCGHCGTRYYPDSEDRIHDETGEQCSARQGKPCLSPDDHHAYTPAEPPFDDWDGSQAAYDRRLLLAVADAAFALVGTADSGKGSGVRVRALQAALAALDGQP